MAKSILVIACGALARDLAEVMRRNGWEHLEVLPLSPELHNTPDQIPAAVREQLDAAEGRYERVFVAYADCGTAGKLDRLLRERGVERLPGAHCYEMFAGARAFAALSAVEPGTFYLTDFLVRHFDRLVVRGLGIDRHPELLATFFGNYRRVVYLAQTYDPELETLARAHARRLGLAYERRHTGLAALEGPVGRMAEERGQWPS